MHATIHTLVVNELIIRIVSILNMKQMHFKRSILKNTVTPPPHDPVEYPTGGVTFLWGGVGGLRGLLVVSILYIYRSRFPMWTLLNLRIYA